MLIFDISIKIIVKKKKKNYLIVLIFKNKNYLRIKKFTFC